MFQRYAPEPYRWCEKAQNFRRYHGTTVRAGRLTNSFSRTATLRGQGAQMSVISQNAVIPAYRGAGPCSYIANRWPVFPPKQCATAVACDRVQSDDLAMTSQTVTQDRRHLKESASTHARPACGLRRWFAPVYSTGSPPSACWTASAPQQRQVPRLAHAHRLRPAASAATRMSPSGVAATCISADDSPSATS